MRFSKEIKDKSGRSLRPLGLVVGVCIFGLRHKTHGLYGFPKGGSEWRSTWCLLGQKTRSRRGQGRRRMQGMWFQVHGWWFQQSRWVGRQWSKLCLAATCWGRGWVSSWQLRCGLPGKWSCWRIGLGSDRTASSKRGRKPYQGHGWRTAWDKGHQSVW